MKKTFFFFSLVIVLVYSINDKIQGQELAELNSTIVKKLKSEYVKDMEYKLNITLPYNYNYSSNVQYPVLFYLDAWMTTGIMNDAYFMVSATRMIEPIILVGISFDGNPEKFFYNRARDYTPTYIPPEKLGENGKMVPTSGGSNEFLKFIKHELIPFIDTEYKIDKNDMAILGYSLGGLFSAFALGSEPSLFKRYGICSPTLLWDNFLVLKNLELINPENEIIIFISNAEFENPGIKEGIPKIKSILEKKENVILKIKEIKGFSHFTGVPAAYMLALLNLYGKN